MKLIINLINTIIISIICIVFILFQTMPSASTLPNSVIEPVPLTHTENINFAPHFQELGIEGAIIIYDLKNERFFQHNPKRNQTAFPVASTFKILNSLIALETGVIKDELALLTWDGISRQIPQWNRDLNMKEAFKLSAVWFYQVLARRVGYEQMQKWVIKAGYGNQNIGDQNEIDQFWLNGKLKITPQEQIEFFRRLYHNKLPFSDKAIAIVKDIMINEKTPDYTLRAKTGWFGFGDETKPNIGWYIGYLEQRENVYFFATNIDIRNKKDPENRIELTRKCLKDLGLL
jgi:beta-lactamase class D